MEANFKNFFGKSKEYLKLAETSMIPAIKKASPAALPAAKLTGHKGLASDKNLLPCFKYICMAVLLGSKSHPKAAGVDKIASAAYGQLEKKHGLSVTYAAWKKAVAKAI
ncbi:MAG: hypothetical protein BM562_01970 [Alphaproteobacteria bacterium MedPE-SWcel]|nr:MAG: hypothetical protein BM562_01970 [Alphaproteobacteria bacterium MedPE-SWcel]